MRIFKEIGHLYWLIYKLKRKKKYTTTYIDNIMRKLSLLFSLFFALMYLPSCGLEDVIPTTTDELSNDDIVAGLKKALEVGTDTSVSILTAQDGYFKDELVKVLLPAEAQPILDGVDDLKKYVDLQPLIDDVVLSMNRSAEKAAVKAQPIFKDAILNMTVTDGVDILYGEDNAATTYLNTNTYTGLKDAFSPDIKKVLDEPIIGSSSTESLYTSLVSKYNTGVQAYNTANVLGIFGDDKKEITGSSLTEHVTTKALDGLFLKVEAEEKDIRKDPLARVTDLLTKVFGKLDNN